MANGVILEFFLSLLLLTSWGRLNHTIFTTASQCSAHDESSCRCDHACLFFEDCCPDYETSDVAVPSDFLDATEGLTSDQLSSIVPPHSDSSGNTTSFLMVGECASNWHNALTRSNCEQPSTESDIFSLTPVSLGTFISFKNAYCAICNRKLIAELIPWTFRSECGSQLPNISSNATFQERVQTLMENCRSWFFIPPSSSSTAVRRCIDNLDPTIPVTREVSMDLTTVPLPPLPSTEPVPDIQGPLISNPYVNITLTGLSHSILQTANIDRPDLSPIPEAPGIDLAPVSVLIDFTSLDDSSFLEDTVSVDCNYTEVFNPSLKSCVKLSCPVGYSLLNRSCIDSTQSNKRCSTKNSRIVSTAALTCEHKAMGVSLCAPSWTIANATVSWLANNNWPNDLMNISVEGISTTWMNDSSRGSAFGTCVQVVIVSFDLSRNFTSFKQPSENALFVVSGSSYSQNLTCRISAVDVSIGCVRKEDRLCLNNSIRFNEFKVLVDSPGTRFFVGERNTTYPIENSLYTQRFRWNHNHTSHQATDLLVCNRGEESSQCALVTLNISDFVVWDNGSILYEPLGVVFDNDDYAVVNNDSIQVCSFFDGSGNVTRQYYFIAFSPGQSITSFVGSLLSMTALVFTFVTYAKFESLRKSICSQLVMSFCVSLTLAQMTLLLSGLAKSSSTSCTCVAVLGHYLWLVVFTHSMALALDLYRRFGLTQKVKKTLESPRILSMFLVFAWGIPLLVVIPCLVVHLCRLPHVTLTYGTVKSCWIGNGFMNLYAFGLPMALTLITNGALFALVIAGLRKRTTQAKKRKTSKMLTDGVLYFKISTLLGFTWLFGFVAAFADVTALWYIFIILNSLQGVYIFIAFVCNNRVFKLWRESCSCSCTQRVSIRITCPCPCSSPGDQSQGNTTSSTWTSSTESTSTRKGTSSISISMTEASSSCSMQEKEEKMDSSTLKEPVSALSTRLPPAQTEEVMTQSTSINLIEELKKKFDNKV